MADCDAISLSQLEMKLPGNQWVMSHALLCGEFVSGKLILQCLAGETVNFMEKPQVKSSLKSVRFYMKCTHASSHPVLSSLRRVN